MKFLKGKAEFINYNTKTAEIQNKSERMVFERKINQQKTSPNS